MTTEEARALVNLRAACGEVAIFVGDADAFYLDACDWDDDRIVVWIRVFADGVCKERIIGRFNTHDEANTFVAAVSDGASKNVKVF